MKTYDIKGKKIARFDGDWQNIVNRARDLNAKIASSEDIVSCRNELPFEHDLWQSGGWTREQPIYSKNSQGILVMDSLLLEPELARKAVEANGNNKYLTLSNEQYKQFLSIAEKEQKARKDKRTVLILPSRNNFEISPSQNFSFFENLVSGRKAEKYFKRLNEKDINIKSITFYTIDSDYVDKQDKPITTELWFRDLDLRSVLDGSLRNFYYGHWAFGVCENAEGAKPRKICTAKNKSEKH